MASNVKRQLVTQFQYEGSETDWTNFEFLKDGNWWTVLGPEKEDGLAWNIHPSDLNHDEQLTLHFSDFDLMEFRLLQLEEEVRK